MPNKSKILSIINCCLSVNLFSEDFATNPIKFKPSNSFSNKYFIEFVVSLSFSGPLVSPYPGVSITLNKMLLNIML